MKIISKATVLSLMVIALASCSIFAPTPAQPIAPTATMALTSANTIQQASTQTDLPVQQYTKTAKPSTIVDTEDGKQFISHEYGFTILLPPDSQSVIPNPDERFGAILLAALPQIYLDDSGHIIPWLHSVVQKPIDKCHPWMPDGPSVPVVAAQVSLGGTSYTKVYTTGLDQDAMQYIDYMTYGTNFCVHFWISLTTYYFDMPIDAQPPSDMLPYIQDDLDRMISTFQWVKS